MCATCFETNPPSNKLKWVVIINHPSGELRHWVPCREHARYVKATYFASLSRDKLTIMSRKQFLDTHPANKYGLR